FTHFPKQNVILGRKRALARWRPENPAAQRLTQPWLGCVEGVELGSTVASLPPPGNDGPRGMGAGGGPARRSKSSQSLRRDRNGSCSVVAPRRERAQMPKPRFKVNWRAVPEAVWRSLVFIVAAALLITIVTRWNWWVGREGWQGTDDAYLTADVT